MFLRKIKTALLVIGIFFSTIGYSQIEISPMAGYFFGGSVNFHEGRLKINDNANFGISISVPMDEESFLEFSYVGSKSTAEWRPYNYMIDYPSQDFELNSNYFLIGGTHQVRLSDNDIYGFGTFKLGAGYFNSLQNNINDTWRFSIGFGLGLKFFITDNIGIRVGGNMYMPLYFNGVGAYVGIGSGGASTGISLNSTAMILQGDFQGGLIFVIGK